MTKMFDSKFDPLKELQLLHNQVVMQQQQILELSEVVKQMAAAHNAHAHLIKQITEQNTELLLLWANTPGNLVDK